MSIHELDGIKVQVVLPPDVERWVPIEEAPSVLASYPGAMLGSLALAAQGAAWELPPAIRAELEQSED